MKFNQLSLFLRHGEIMLYTKTTKNRIFYCISLLRETLPQSLDALRLLFFRVLLPDFYAGLSFGKAGVFFAPSLASDQKAQNRAPLTSPREFAGRGIGHLHETRGGRTWQTKHMNHNGQNIIEYAIVIALVSAAMIAMSTYVYRSTQATQKVIEEEFQNE